MDCDVEFLDPALWPLTDYRAGTYRHTHTPVPGRGMGAEEIFNYYVRLQGKRIERLVELTNSSSVVLDVGCSSGYLLSLLRPSVGDVIGVELNSFEAEFTRSRLGIRVSEEPIEATDLQPGIADLIVITDVIEHVSNPVGFLKAAAKLLKSGGVVYLETPNRADALLRRWRVQAYRSFWYKLPHLFYFTHDSLAFATSRAGGLADIRNIQTYGLLNHLHWVLRGLPQSSYDTAIKALGEVVPDSNDQWREDDSDFRQALNAIDATYRGLLERLGSADTLVATIRF